MRLRNPTSRFIFLVLILILVYNVSFAGELTPFTGEINANNINLRSDATTSASVIGVLNKGERVEVVLALYEWYKIRLPKNLPIYIKKSLASCIDYSQPQSTHELKACLTAKVSNDRVNIRAKPSESSAIVGVADKNEIISVIAEESSWYKIEPIQNSFGWIHKKFVDIVKLRQEKVIPPAIIQEENLVVLKGVVRPYGNVFRRKATHKLITADNKVFLLKGNRSSLNALNHKEVKVIGKIISLQAAKTPIVEVRIIEVAN